MPCRCRHVPPSLDCLPERAWCGRNRVYPHAPKPQDCYRAGARQAGNPVTGSDRSPRLACQDVPPSPECLPGRAESARNRAYPHAPTPQGCCPAGARQAGNPMTGSDRSPRLACRDVRPSLDCLPGRARWARNPASGSARSPHRTSRHVPSQPGCSLACARRAGNLAPGAGRSRDRERPRVPRLRDQRPARAERAPSLARGRCRPCQGRTRRPLWPHSPQLPPGRAPRRRR